MRDDAEDEPPTALFVPDGPDTDPVIEKPSEEFGPYLVYERLGAGGMATVHRAEKRGLAGFRRTLALKRMMPDLSQNADFVKSFAHEAKLASRLAHTNIAQAYDLGKIDGVYYIAMELVPGPTLTQVMRRCEDAGAMPVPIVVAILAQICEALEYAHGLCDESGAPLGIVHRDISPGNVIVSNTGTAKLIDFGIAKATSSTVRTQVGVVKGKFAYIAPEYVATSKVDARGDLFGLGVIAHELLTNRRLFHAGNDMDTVRNVLEMPIQPPSRWREGVSNELDHVVLTALQRLPAKRWQNASAMRTALAGVARELGSHVGPPQIAAWTVRAFGTTPRAVSQLGNVIANLEPSVSVQVMGDDFVAEPSTAIGTPPPPKPVAPPPIQARVTARVIPLPPPVADGATEAPAPRSRVLLLVLIVIALAAAGFAVAYLGYV
jgi:serine/threonine protein kinase